MHRRIALLVLLLLLAPARGRAQTLGVETKPAPAAGPGRVIKRYFELQSAALSTRYRFIKTSQGVVTSDQVQHREVFTGRFKFDDAGRFSINSRAGTGTSFVGSWNTTGIGTGDLRTNLHLEHLFLAGEPYKGLELQFGGMDAVRGESTEITTYDNDAYIVGERMRLRRAKDLFFDEISITYAYVGDANQRDLMKRFHRIKQSNYHQFLVAKRIGKRAAVSADYSFQSGAETMREAVSLQTRELRIVDSLRLENYQRMDVRRDFGFAVTAEKQPLKRFRLSGGYAKLDPYLGGFNADRMLNGNRLFFLGTVTLLPDFTVATFLTHAIGNNSFVPIGSRYELVFAYNLLPALKRTGIF